MKWICSLITALLLTTSSAAQDMVVEIYGGSPGCDRWMHTNFFEIAPGETVSINIDLTECGEDMFQYGFVYYGYKDGQLANYLTKSDGIVFEIADADGNIIDPRDFDGCYLKGRSTGVWLDVNEPIALVLLATNSKPNSKLIRLQSSTNNLRRKGC